MERRYIESAAQMVPVSPLCFWGTQQVVKLKCIIVNEARIVLESK
jgi:hypothetical protein